MTVIEGNSGTTIATFTVTRTGGTDAFNVNFATADAGAEVLDGDYVAASGTLQFGANVNTQQITVTINGDTTLFEIARLGKNQARQQFESHLTATASPRIIGR